MVPEVIDVITVMRTCTSRRKQQLNVFTFGIGILDPVSYIYSLCLLKILECSILKQKQIWV